jgi:hypothetical protein
MYRIESAYGKKTYDVFCDAVKRRTRFTSLNLTDTRQSAEALSNEAKQNDWTVDTYPELGAAVSFLTGMNKRLTLFFRGQCGDFIPKPTLFRDAWTAFDGGPSFPLTDSNRQKFWEELQNVGHEVTELCINEIGVPRPRTLKLIREAQWAIVQHYGLWPTALIDITQNLRVAASFACHGNETGHGYVYVVGMPNCTGSVTFDVDQHIVLARLSAICPPIAVRPHLQEGFLAGRFPLHTLDSQRDLNAEPELSNLERRLIARIRLVFANGSGTKHGFWSEDFPMISTTALYQQKNDPLYVKLREVFGKDGLHSVSKRAALLCRNG